MPKTIPANIRLGAIDRISKTLDKVKRKFPGLSKAARKAADSFRLMQKRTAKLRASLSRMGGKMKSVGRSMTMGMTAPIAAAGFTFIRTAVNFTKSINKVGAITGTLVDGKITPAFSRLEGEAKRLGATTEFSASQAADAMVVLGRAGFKTEEIIGATGHALAMASANGVDLAMSADMMAKTIRQFGLTGEKDFGRVADVISNVSRKSNVDLEMMMETFKDAAPVAKAYGATLEQTAALTGLLGDIGIQGSKAGTTLKNVFLKLADPSDTARKMFDKMNIALVNSDGSMKAVGQVLTELGPALSKLNKGDQLAVMNEIFGLRGIAGATGLMAKAMKEGKNPVAAFTAVIQKSDGVAKEMQKNMQRGAVGAFARFQSAFEAMSISIAESGFLDFVVMVVTKLTDLFTWLSNTHPAWLKWGTIIAGVAAVLGPLIFTFGMLIQGISMMLPILGALKLVMTGIAIVFGLVSAPVWLIVAGVTALVAAIVRVIMKWKELKAAFTTSGSFLSGLKKASKIFFGFGGGEAPAKGASVGAAGAVNQAASTSVVPGQPGANGQINVNFANMPKGTKVEGGGDAIAGMNLGYQGGTL